jgi:hypothetical protein
LASARPRAASSALRFPSATEAADNAEDLLMRWTTLTASRAAPTDDEPTHRYVNHRLVTVEDFDRMTAEANAIDQARAELREVIKEVDDLDAPPPEPPSGLPSQRNILSLSNDTCVA